MKAAIALLAVLIAFVVAPGAAPNASAAAASFDPAECPVAPPDGIPEDALSCGYVTVPEDRAQPNGAEVRLAVAVIERDGPVEDDPILYLSGGPGGPSLQGEMYGFGAARVSDAFPDRDIIFFDQRGTGLSTPSLFCDELADFTLEVLIQGWSPDEADAESDERLRACANRLTSAGVDLQQYSSAISANDVVDVMTALGYETFNLYGISYGTRLALTVMRDHPEHVRAAVIDSVLPPNVEGALSDGWTFTRSLDVLFADCAADPACNAAYPDLEAKTFALANSANADPIEITINDSDANPVEISIDGNAILQGAFTAFYDTGLIPLLPFAAYEIADGNTALLTALAQQIVFAFSGTAVGMQSSVNCNEETPFYTQAKLDEALTGVRQEVIDAHIGITTAPALDRALRFCDDVIGTEPPAIENQAVVSDIPTLALSGQYDPVTPPQWGELAAATLSTSYAFEFPATGHGVITSRPECAGSIASQFFAEPQLAPASGCVSEIPPPAFQLRAAPAPTPAPAPTESSGVIAPPDTGSGELAGDRPIQIVLALAMVGVMLSAAGWYARTRM